MTNSEYRDRVNAAIESEKHPCVPVSEDFADEMLCVLPPESYKNNGMYTTFQVGEATTHKRGVPVYETYQVMHAKAVDAGLADARMTVGQWYFTGLHPVIEQEPRQLACRLYECRECGNRVTIQTNHTMDCYPTCVGKCRQYIRTGKGASEQEHVIPKQTAHKFIGIKD